MAHCEADGAFPTPLTTLFEWRESAHDVLSLNNGDVVRGRLLGDAIAVITPYGRVEVPTNRCAVISLENRKMNSEAVATTNYDRITGIIDAGALRFRIGGFGPEMTVPKAQIRHILLRKTAADSTPADPTSNCNLYVMANNDLLTGTDDLSEFKIRTEQGEQQTIPVSDVRYIKLRDGGDLTGVVNKKDETAADEQSPSSGRRRRAKARGLEQRCTLLTEEINIKLDVGSRLDGVATEQVSKIFLGEGNARPNSHWQWSRPYPPLFCEQWNDMFTNSIGMQMKLVLPGSFVMGSENGKDDEKPAHKVTITRPFFIGAYEVTQKQYTLVMGKDKNPSTVKGDRLPVDNVTWDDAQNFCSRLWEMENCKYRLPTEAEWEYACRAGTDTEYWWGADFKPNGAWCASPEKKKEGTIEQVHWLIASNPWGLFNMTGNLCEWVEDSYVPYTGEDRPDASAISVGGARVVRGGSWQGPPEDCRSSARMGRLPWQKDNTCGFRVVRVFP